MKIKITKDDIGLPEAGSVIEVSDDRASRWIKKGYAVACSDSTPAPAPEKVEVSEEKPAKKKKKKKKKSIKKDDE